MWGVWASGCLTRQRFLVVAWDSTLLGPFYFGRRWVPSGSDRFGRAGFACTLFFIRWRGLSFSRWVVPSSQALLLVKLRQEVLRT